MIQPLRDIRPLSDPFRHRDLLFHRLTCVPCLSLRRISKTRQALVRKVGLKKMRIGFAPRVIAGNEQYSQKLTLNQRVRGSSPPGLTSTRYGIGCDIQSHILCLARVSVARGNRGVSWPEKVESAAPFGSLPYPIRSHPSPRTSR